MKRTPLVLVLLGSVLTPTLAVADPPPLLIHFIDVGQGDATLFEFPCGAVLVDTGSEDNPHFDGPKALTGYLDAFFDRRTDLHRTLDLLAITHPHIDHTENIRAVVSRYRVKNVAYNGQFPRDRGGKPLRFLRRWAKKNDVPAQSIVFNTMWQAQPTTSPILDPLDCGEVDPQITALWGQLREDPGWGWSYGKRRFSNPNNHSLVLRIDYDKAAVLLTGDLEEEAIGSLLGRYQGNPLLDVDVYQVGHHGSKNGTTEKLLDAMKPKAAVISMGAACRRDDYTAWDHGHPNRKIVELLAKSVQLSRPQVDFTVFDGQNQPPGSLKLKKAVYGTGFDGTVIVKAKASGWIDVETLDQAGCD
jgi:competence protein ComEC